jgi:hypothetical protein
MVSKSPVSARSFRAFGLALIASLAFAGLATANASALSLDAPSVFSPKLSNEGFISMGSNIYACTGGGWNSGQFTTKTSGEITLTFKGCGASGFTLTTPGQEKGTIKTSSLTMKPVYLDAAHTKFGLLLSPPASGIFAEVLYGGIPVAWKGSLIGQITSPGLMGKSKDFTLNFAKAGTGQQYRQVEESGPIYHVTQNEAEVVFSSIQTSAFPAERTWLP